MNHASGTIAPLDPELIQLGDAMGQRAQRRGLVQGSVRPDARSLEHRVECGGEAGVPVVQDELCPCPGVFQVNEQVPGLLHYPRLDRMLGGSEDPDAGGVLDDGKDVDLRAARRSAGTVPASSASHARSGHVNRE